MNNAYCLDCGAQYGTDGWCDVIIPDDIWSQICPEGGILCFKCMTVRIESHGLDNIPVAIRSGPYLIQEL